MRKRYRYDKERDAVVEIGSVDDVPRANAWSKPLQCEALAVDPRHIKFQKQLDAERGLGDVEYNQQTGAPVFHSQSRYNDYKRAYGYYDRNCGYSGVPPQHR